MTIPFGPTLLPSFPDTSLTKSPLPLSIVLCTKLFPPFAADPLCNSIHALFPPLPPLPLAVSSRIFSVEPDPFFLWTEKFERLERIVKIDRTEFTIEAGVREPYSGPNVGRQAASTEMLASM